MLSAVIAALLCVVGGSREGVCVLVAPVGGWVFPKVPVILKKVMVTLSE